MSDSRERTFDPAKHGFTGLFRLSAVEVKRGDSNGETTITFRFPSGDGAYFTPGDSYFASFQRVDEDK